MICVIVSAGDFHGEIPAGFDFLIAVDGGLKHCLARRLKYDVIIGDFDSLGYVPVSENVIQLPQDKNESDTFFAVSYAIDNRFDEIHIFGGTGGRNSHTLANIQTLKYLASKNIVNFMYDKEEIYTVIATPKDVDISKKSVLKVKFTEEKKGFISVFSSNPESVVTIKGLKYELDNAVITDKYPYGLSNEFIGKESSVEVIDGTILIGYPVEYGSKGVIHCGSEYGDEPVLQENEKIQNRIILDENNFTENRVLNEDEFAEFLLGEELAGLEFNAEDTPESDTRWC
ncbi:MAG: thiamine diphosphokinase [Oscillospiraceae bacterium]|jgi:thiamine pyrophosphokinase|nr:thiamine diphosphokinase [Oscillospiraceae bacterium]